MKLVEWVYWKCPKCGTNNRNTIDHADMFACKCSECKAEVEVYFDVEVTVNEIRMCEYGGLGQSFIPNHKESEAQNED